MRRSFEAYLLWLFGWVMFLGTSGSSVDKVMIHYARAIADADVGCVPQWSWGSAVLAATYRSLCDACTKNDANSLITGCPLLLMLWAAERFAIARLVVSPETYPDSFYRQSPEDRPTMGTLWCRYEVCDFNEIYFPFLILTTELYPNYTTLRCDAATLRAPAAVGSGS